jgi:hypothetical protein
LGVEALRGVELTNTNCSCGLTIYQNRLLDGLQDSTGLVRIYKHPEYAERLCENTAITLQSTTLFESIEADVLHILRPPNSTRIA